jgi:hypothetical protein
MSIEIFIAYRRQDTSGYALGLGRAIKGSEALPGVKVFLDSDDLKPGASWEEEIRASASACDVALVLIGDEWLVTRDGQRKLEQEHDPVHAELELLLGRDGIKIIPVLLEEAKMPTRRDLPEKVHGLLRANAHRIHDASYDRDVNDLIEQLTAIDEERGAPPAAGPSSQIPQADAPMGFPERITQRFLEQEVRGMGRDRVLALVAELRRRGRTDDEIYEEALNYSQFQPPDRLPTRITVAWLAANVPFLSPSRIRELSAELVRRGWSAEEIRKHVFEHRQTGLAEKIPASIRIAWLERNTPLMTIDEQDRLASVMLDRGWPPEEVGHHLPFAATLA